MVKGPVSQRRISRRALRRAVMLGAATLAVIVLAVSGFFAYHTHKRALTVTGEKVLEAQARHYAQQVAKPFSEVDAKLQAVARAPDVIAAFTARDASALAAAAKTHESAFANVEKLRLLLPSQYQGGVDGQSSLSFATLDMLRRAAHSDGTVGAEVDLFGSPRQHIAMVERATDKGGELIGLLHLSLNVSMFEPILKGLDAHGGYLELVQGAGRDAVKLATAGNQAVAAGAPLHASVPDTRWSLLYWPPPAAGGTAQLPWLGVVLAIVLILVVVAAFRVLRRPRSSTAVAASPGADSGVVYAGAVKAIMEGAHPGMKMLVPNLPRMGQKSTIEPVSQGMVGDDITMILNKDDLAKEAGDVLNISPASERRGDEQAAPSPKQAPRKPPKPKPKLASTSTAKTKAAPEKSVLAAAVVTESAGEVETGTGVEVSPNIFRAYDIRGVVGKELTADVVQKLGRTLGSEALARSQKVMVAARDGRKSSPEFSEALGIGLMAAGVDVVDIGEVPTPLLYFATHETGVNSGVMVTGSHNGPEYNGFKVVLAGETLSESALRAIYDRIRNDDMASGSGSYSSREVIADYVRRVTEDVPVALGHSFKVAVDCGNGVAGVVAPQLLRALGHDVIELFCDVDGSFPNHHPDPSQPENLAALIEKVKSEQADLGLAFDGDGDRLGVVDGHGNIIWPDRQLMLLARDLLSRNAGATVLFDVKCSRYLRAIIESSGGKPLMCRTGHSLIKAKMKETGALLAGEMSGHIFFKERWYGFDDALYAAARLLEVLTKSKATPTETFAELPQGVSTPELRITLPEQAHADFMDQLKSKMAFEGANIIDIDGFRVEFTDGWGLIRPSNTSPALVLRFEADDQQALERIEGEFRQLILSVRSDLKLPF